jgi:large subunit ribosomal protein L15
MEEQERIGLHNLSPTPGSTKERKRVGRGQGSGTGKTSGRGQKGQKSRSGSHMMRAGFIGGQMPMHMQVPKLRGAHSKDAMPVGPFRTFTHGVNVSSLAARFEAGAEVTPEALLAARVLRTLRHPVKILGDGEIGVALTVHAHRFSASARQKIEAAGGTVVLINPVEEPEAPVRDEVKRAASEARAEAAAKAPKKKKPAADADADVAADAADEREEAKRAAAEARAAKKQPEADGAAVDEPAAEERAAEEPVAEEPGPAAEEPAGEQPVAEGDEPANDEASEGDEA